MAISIHAPSRERQLEAYQHIRDKENFNPRSLAGATPLSVLHTNDNIISIHAPSRERLSNSYSPLIFVYFNPRSLAGATGY